MKVTKYFVLLIFSISLLGCASIKKVNFDDVGLSEPVGKVSLITIDASKNPNLYFTQGIKSKTILIPKGITKIPVCYVKVIGVFHDYNIVTTKFEGYIGAMRGVDLDGGSEYELKYKIKNKIIHFWLVNKSSGKVIEPKSIDENRFNIMNQFF